MTDEHKEDREPDFEIIDRRGASSEGEKATPEEGTPPEDTAQAAEAERAPSGEPEQPSQEEAGAEAEEAREARPMTAEDIITMSIGLLQQQAWVSMGLVMDPTTKTVTKDLEQAKLAIDAVAALANLIAPGLEESVQRELRAMVSDLQVNFVQQQ